MFLRCLLLIAWFLSVCWYFRVDLLLVCCLLVFPVCLLVWVLFAYCVCLGGNYLSLIVMVHAMVLFIITTISVLGL